MSTNSETATRPRRNTRIAFASRCCLIEEHGEMNADRGNYPKSITRNDVFPCNAARWSSPVDRLSRQRTAQISDKFHGKLHLSDRTSPPDPPRRRLRDIGKDRHSAANKVISRLVFRAGTGDGAGLRPCQRHVRGAVYCRG